MPEFQDDTGYSKAELWIVDLANFNSVLAFADKAERELGRLDILIENASIATWDYEQVEGWEKTYVACSFHEQRLTVILAYTQIT